MYDEHWPIWLYLPNYPPPKFVFNGSDNPERCGRAVDSIVCQGSIISGGFVDHSIISSNVRVNSFATVEDSIVFEGVDIGRHAKVRRAIIDKNVHIPPGVHIGYDVDLDRDRGLQVTESGIVVIAKADGVENLTAESEPLRVRADD
jgi:glucose-1-phosphate adenylyltransferase